MIKVIKIDFIENYNYNQFNQIIKFAKISIIIKKK